MIVLDVNDEKHPVGFNLLDQRNPASVVDELISLFNELFRDNQSLRMQEVMYHGLLTPAERMGATFTDLAALVSPNVDEVDWPDDVIRGVKDPQLKKFVAALR